jgi:uncharacterized protein (UPF0335 family)
MSDNLAENQLAAFIDRILRLKTEADDIASDIKEIYQEAHANGFNKTRLGEVVTYLRKVEKDATGEAEKAALRDLYLDGYYRAKNQPHAYARARGGNSEPAHDPETGEITEPQSAPQAAQAGAAHEPVASALVESEAVEISTPIQPETANEIPNDPTNGGPHESAAHPVPVIDPGRRLNDPHTAEEQTNEVASTSAHIVAGEGAHNASVTTFIPKPIRPNCQRPERCGGQGRQHCYSCRIAAEQAGAA